MLQRIFGFPKSMHLDAEYPVPIDILNDATTLSIQQALVFQYIQNAYQILNEANDRLDRSAVTLLQGGILVVVLASAFNIPNLLTDNHPFAKWILALVLILFLLMVVFSRGAWSPYFEMHLPGSLDWDEIASKFINVDSNASFARFLSSYIKAIENLQGQNHRKRRWVIWSLNLFMGQLALLIFLAIIALFV